MNLPDARDLETELLIAKNEYGITSLRKAVFVRKHHLQAVFDLVEVANKLSNLCSKLEIEKSRLADSVRDIKILRAEEHRLADERAESDRRNITNLMEEFNKVCKLAAAHQERLDSVALHAVQIRVLLDMDQEKACESAS